jgi:uncharacterized protein YnzC (UPF0291/DUF896 family)
MADGFRSVKNKLETLVINVHGIDSEHQKVTNHSWRQVRKNCPTLEVTVNLIHSYDGVQGLLDILQPSLPLTCFRQLFCTDLNPSAINYFSSNYKDTLTSVYIIDGLNESGGQFFLTCLQEWFVTFWCSESIPWTLMTNVSSLFLHPELKAERSSLLM